MQSRTDTEHGRGVVNANAPALSSPSARILYAEDDELVRELTFQILSRAGYAITSVPDGQSAWEALNAANFDLLITDNDMPHITGLELVAKLRRKKVTMPVILASGSADFFSGEDYRWLGVSAYLQKPLLSAKLIETVQQALGA